MKQEQKRLTMVNYEHKPLATVDRCQEIAASIVRTTDLWFPEQETATVDDLPKAKLCLAVATATAGLIDMARGHGNASIAEMILANVEEALR